MNITDEMIAALRSRLTSTSYADDDECRAALAAALAAQPSEPTYYVAVRGRLHDPEPAAAAFALPDGRHALYTAPQPARVPQPRSLRPLREGEVMGAYMDFDRVADRKLSSTDYLLQFGLHVSRLTVEVNSGGRASADDPLPTPATPPVDARKPCTCDGAGRGPGRPCVVEAGGALGKLWRCAQGHESQTAPQPVALPALPEREFLGDSEHYGYDAESMRAYGIKCLAAAGVTVDEGGAK